ncbi:hypothetical protein ACVRWF_10080 [Streptococcus uberis]
MNATYNIAGSNPAISIRNMNRDWKTVEVAPWLSLILGRDSIVCVGSIPTVPIKRL